MSPNPFDENNPIFVINSDYESKVIPTNVEDNAFSADDAGVPIGPFDVTRCSPNSGLRIGEPGLERLLCFRMRLPVLP